MSGRSLRILLGDVCRDSWFVGSVASRQDLRLVILAKQEVDDVEETEDVIILVFTNGDEDGRYTRGDTDSVLDVEVLKSR